MQNPRANFVVIKLNTNFFNLGRLQAARDLFHKYTVLKNRTSAMALLRLVLIIQKLSGLWQQTKRRKTSWIFDLFADISKKCQDGVAQIALHCSSRKRKRFAKIPTYFCITYVDLSISMLSFTRNVAVSEIKQQQTGRQTGKNPGVQSVVAQFGLCS